MHNTSPANSLLLRPPRLCKDAASPPQSNKEKLKNTTEQGNKPIISPLEQLVWFDDTLFQNTASPVRRMSTIHTRCRNKIYPICEHLKADKRSKDKIMYKEDISHRYSYVLTG